LPELAQNMILLLVPPTQLGLQEPATMPNVLVKMHVLITFCPGWPRTVILSSLSPKHLGLQVYPTTPDATIF
jgi:hypothetical protein